MSVRRSLNTVAGCLAALALLLGITGLTPTDALLTAALLCFSTFSGFIVVRSFVSSTRIDQIALGIPIGALLHVTTFMLFAPAMPPFVVFALTIALSAIPWRLRRPIGNRQQLLERSSGRNAAVLALGALAGCLGAAGFWMRHRLEWSGAADIHDDIVYHQALIGAATGGWPVNSPLLGGEPLSYHWFTNAWAAFVETSLSLPPLVALTRAVPIMAILGACATAAAWAWRILPHWHAALAASLGISSVGYLAVGPRVGTPIEHISPSEAFSTMFLLATCLVIWMYRDDDLSPRTYATLLGVLLFATTGAKLSQAVVALGGLGALSLSELLRGSGIRVRLPDCAAPAGFALGYLVFHARGDSHDLRIGISNPVSGVTSAFSGLQLPLFGWGIWVLAITAVLGPVFASFWLVRRSTTLRFFLIGASTTGCLLSVFTSSPGESEAYFLTAVLKLFIVVASCEVARLTRDSQVQVTPSRWRIGLAGTATIGVCTFASVSYFIRSPGAWFGPVRMLTVLAVSGVAAMLLLRSPTVRVASAGWFAGAGLSTILGSLIMAAGDIKLEPEIHASTGPRSAAFEIGRELHALSGPGDLVITNRFCREASQIWPGCSTKWFEASAATGRSALIEGIEYAVGTEPTENVVERVDISSRVVNHADRRSAQRAYELGVRWIWFDRLIAEPPEWEEIGTLELQNEYISVVRLSGFNGLNQTALDAGESS